MKKKVIVGLLIVISLSISAGLIYYFYMPQYAADLILQEDIPAYIPQKYAEKLKEIKKPLAKYSEDVFKISDSLNLSLELILKVIDEINTEEILVVYEKLENKEVTNSEDVFLLIRSTITVNEINVDAYKPAFIKFATPGRINRVLRYAETHELATTLGPEAAKKIAKQLVIKHYEQKKKELGF